MVEKIFVGFCEICQLGLCVVVQLVQCGVFCYYFFLFVGELQFEVVFGFVVFFGFGFQLVDVFGIQVCFDVYVVFGWVVEV